MCARLIFIKPDKADSKRIEELLNDESFGKSYFFKGYGKYSKTLFYVTHGDQKGFVVINEHSKGKIYTQKEFAFYMCGLIESSPYRNDVDEVITTECFGGYHHPTKLNICGREVTMKSISNQRAQLWAGWGKRECGDYIFDAFIATNDEFTKIAIKYGNLMPNLSLRSTNSMSYEDAVYLVTQLFVQNKVDLHLNSLPKEFDLIEKEVTVDEIFI